MRPLVLAIVGISIWSTAQTQSPSPHLIVPLKPLLQAFDNAKVSGSLELSGHCGVGLPPHLPHLRPPKSGASPLQVARDVFSGDPSMQISQDPNGTVRMIERGTSAELLNVKIGHVSFDKNGAPLKYAAFAPGTALYYVILQSPEILAFERARNIQIPFVGIAGRLGTPTNDLPHLSGSMDDLTLSQALDRLLQTFPGIWAYESCPAEDKDKGLVVSFWFFSLRDPGVFAE